MKIHALVWFLFSSAAKVAKSVFIVLVGVGLCTVANQASANTYYTNTVQGSGSWNTANLWSSSTAGTPGNYTMVANADPNDFVVLPGATLRSTSVTTFQGNSLTMEGTLTFKDGGTLDTSNNTGITDSINFNASTAATKLGLIMSGGTLNPGDTEVDYILKGSLTVAANSYIDLLNGGQGGGAGQTLVWREFDLEMSIAGSNTINLINLGTGTGVSSGTNNSYASGSYLIVGNNGGSTSTTFSGNWNLTSYGLVTNGQNVLGMSTGSLAGGYGVSTISMSTGTVFNLSGTGSSNSQAIAGLVSTTSGTSSVLLGPNTLTINGNSITTYSGIISGAGGLSISSSNGGLGGLYLAGANTYTGPTLVNVGVLGINGAVGSGSGGGTAITVNSSGTLTEGSGGAISGSSSIAYGGRGASVLSGVNTYAGATTISGGTLVAAATGALSGNSAFTINNSGHLAITAGAQAMASLALAGSNTVIPITGGGSLNVKGSVMGTGSLTMQSGDSTGLLALNGADSYGGATTVTGGELDFANANSIPNASSGTISASGIGVLAIQAQTTNAPNGWSNANIAALVGALGSNPNFNNSSLIATGGVALDVAGIDQFTNTNNMAIGVSGTNGFAKLDTGTLIMSGTNTYTGSTVVVAGTLQFANSTALYNGNTAAWTPGNIVVASGATFSLNVGGPNDFTLAQAGALLGSLSSSTALSGLSAGAKFGLDTTDALSAVTYGGTITDTTAGALGFAKLGTGTLYLTATNSYTGGTTITNGQLIITGANSGTGAVTATSNIGGLTVLSLRNNFALGTGTANSSLSPITMLTTAGTGAVILEIGAKIGTDPGPYNADFSYQIVAPAIDNNNNAVATGVVAGPGQINFSFPTTQTPYNAEGFAAYNATSLTTPRIVALYSPTSGTNTAVVLAPFDLKQQLGNSDTTITFGAPTANNTLILENGIDFASEGSERTLGTIRGVGIEPEGEIMGPLTNALSGVSSVGFNFIGNGGLIFASSASVARVTAGAGASVGGLGQLQIIGGALYIAASDPALAITSSQSGVLGEGNATLQIGVSSVTGVSSINGGIVTTNSAANLGFMTYGPGSGITSLPSISSSRNIAVGGNGVVYNSVTLGGFTDDYTAMSGTIALNEAPSTPTTFLANNGGRVDFNGAISGVGSVVIGGAGYVEGDSTAAGIAVSGSSGVIAFNGSNTYSGATTVAAGTFLVNGSLASSTLVTINPGGVLSGTGAVNGPVAIGTGGLLQGTPSVSGSVTVASGGTLAGGGTISGAVSLASGGVVQAGGGTLTLAGGVTLNGPATFAYTSLNPVGSPSLLITGSNTLVFNSNIATIDITGAISSSGNYALLNYSGISSSGTSGFALAAPLPSRGIGFLVANGSELDLDVTSLASIVWTGSQGSSWDTVSTNWVQQGMGGTTYINNPGDSVIFDDTAGTNNNVVINAGNVTPTSVTFNNNTVTYTISGSNGIAGSTGLQLTGTGTVILLTNNSYIGPTSIALGATLQLGNGTPGNDGSISQSSAIIDNGTLIYNIVGAQTYGGAISGSGSVAIGPGSVTLTNTNSYSGGTTINGGTLQLGLGINGNDGLINGNITDNGSLIFNYYGNYTIATSISGSGSVTKFGIGSMTLTGSNPYGSTTVGGGLLEATTSASLGNYSGGTVAVVGGATLALQVQTPNNPSGFSNANLASLVGNSATTFAAGSTLGLDVVGSDMFTPTINLAVAVGGANGFAKLGTGTLILTTSNIFTGATSINAGTLQLGTGASGNDGSLASSSIVNNGSLVFDLAGSQTVSAVISGSGSVTTNGTSLLTFAGTNSYAGGTTINGGTLSVSVDKNLGAVPSSVQPANVTINGGEIAFTKGTLDSAASSATTLNTNRGITLGPSGGTININFQDTVTGNHNGSESALVYNGVIGGSGGLTISGVGGAQFTTSGASIFDLGNTATYTGNTTVSDAVLQANPGTSKLFTSLVNMLPTNTTLVLVNSGAVNLDDNSSNLQVAGISGDATGVIGTSNNSTSVVVLTLGGSDIYTFPGVIGPGEFEGKAGIASLIHLVMAGAGTQILTGVNTYSGSTAISSGTLQLGNGGTTGSIASSTVTDNGVLAINLAGSVPQSNVIAGTLTGGGELAQMGPGLFILSVANGYSGGTYVSGGTLRLFNSSGMGTGGLTANGGVFDLYGNSPASVPSFSGSAGTVTNGLASTVAVLNVNNTNPTTFSGSIQDGLGQAGLQMNGGVLTLAGTSNTYSGPTNINGGSLIAAQAAVLSTSSAVTVNNGTLDVTAGPQTIGSLTMGSGGALNLSVGNLLSSLGASSFNGSINVSGTSALPVVELMSYPSFSGAFSAPAIPSGYNLVYAANQLDLYSLTGPNTWAIAGSGSWNSASNWSTITIPNGPGVLAVMGTVPNTATTVTLDGAQEIGTLLFSGTVPYTIAAGSGGTLTLSNTGTSPAQVSVLAGSQTISAPLILAGMSSLIALSGGGKLNISGSILDGTSGSSALIVSSSDNSGELILSGSNYFGGGTTLSSGVLVLDGAPSLLAGSSLTIGSGAGPGAVFAPISMTTLGHATSTLAPVPEPGTLAMLIIAVLTGLGICRRRNRFE